MIIALLMGFSAGLPLSLATGSTLQAWMVDEKVNLTVIGLFSLVGLPYTLKFLWSPLMDRYKLFGLPRRKGWLLLTQCALALSLVALAFSKPALNPWLVAIFAFCAAFWSASQDIVIDAYRRESLKDEELGLGSTMYVSGYRIAGLISVAIAISMATYIPWHFVYLIMALLMVVGISTTLLAPEPNVGVALPKTLREAVIDPFVEYFTRRGAITMLAFILLYKLGDVMASAMTTPFILSIGFTKLNLAAIAKGVGFAATIAGGFIGGALILRLGINKCLWIFGAFQMISTFGFALLARTGPDLYWLGGVIAFENLTAGMGTSALGGFMAALTNKKFTATQFALLTSLMGVPRVFLSAPTGFMAQSFGWEGFFIFCGLVAIPGMLMLSRFAPWRQGLMKNSSRD
jgi:PAT family beta-lactamase induction signal transducer AmpG